MSISTHHLDFEQSAFPDSGGAHCSYLFVGGASEVKAAEKRHGGLEYMALVTITVVSVSFLVYWFCRADNLEFAFAIGISGLLAPFIGSSIHCLAASSLASQEKAGKSYEAAWEARRFFARQLFVLLRWSVCRLSALLPHAHALVIQTLQRTLAATANLAHIALSPRLLVIPFCVR